MKWAIHHFLTCEGKCLKVSTFAYNILFHKHEETQLNSVGDHDVKLDILI